MGKGHFFFFLKKEKIEGEVWEYEKENEKNHS